MDLKLSKGFFDNFKWLPMMDDKSIHMTIIATCSCPPSPCSARTAASEDRINLAPFPVLLGILGRNTWSILRSWVPLRRSGCIARRRTRSLRVWWICCSRGTRDCRLSGLFGTRCNPGEADCLLVIGLHWGRGCFYGGIECRCFIGVLAI